MKFDFSKVEMNYIYDSLYEKFTMNNQEILDIEKYLKKEHSDKFLKVVKSESRKLKILKLDQEVLNKLINRLEGDVK